MRERGICSCMPEGFVFGGLAVRFLGLFPLSPNPSLGKSDGWT
jgi:hypothetical protein